MNNMPSAGGLSVAVLVHDYHKAQLAASLQSLAQACAELELHTGISARVWLLDNGDASQPQRLQSLLEACEHRQGAWQLCGGLPNHGYGHGHNIALRLAEGWGARWHLVMNPDVRLAPDSLRIAIDWLVEHPECGLLSPACTDWDCIQPQYLARTVPGMAVLIMRNLPKRWLTAGMQKILARHCYADLDHDCIQADLETQSGCFMLGPRAAFAEVGGFDQAYFMYFEDLDLSLRMRRFGWRISYHPEVRIEHAGGGTLAKGMQHARWFLASALRFYLRHPSALWRLR